ncbi:hypothetical protein [Pyruvatibacter mobilis]
MIFDLLGILWFAVALMAFLKTLETICNLIGETKAQAVRSRL